MRLSTLEIGRAQLDSVTEIALNLYMPNLLRQRKAFTLDTRNTCIAKPREARGGGGRPIKCRGWKGERIGVKFNSHRIGLEHQHGRCFIVLANVT